MTERKPLRVLHVVPRFNHGGVARVICDLMEGSRETTGFVACADGDWMDYLRATKVGTFSVPLQQSTPLNLLRAARALRRVVRKHSIDVVHSHHRFASLVSRIAVRGTGIPYVASVHDMASGNTLLSRFAFGPSIMVYSDSVAAHLRDHFGVPAERITKVPMGMKMPAVDTRAAAKLRSEFNAGEGSPVIVFGGRADLEKGPDIFIDAIPQIANAFPSARFWFVGDGDMRPSLEQRCRSVGISDVVRFTGWRDDIDVVLAAADILVAPSRREGFGRSVLEAMSLGKAVVATRTGGLGQLIDDGRNGLIAAADPEAMASAVIRILGDQELSKTIRRGARETAEKYDRESMIRATEDVYRRVRGER